MTYPLVRDLAAEDVPVTVTCRVLGFSPQGYYRWLACPVSDRDWNEAHLVNAIWDIHADDPEFGYRFIADELGRLGWQVGENRVQRLCQVFGIWSTTTRKGRKNTRKAGPPVHDDLIQRDFDIDGLDRVDRATSPSIPPPRAPSMSARSRTPARGGSPATPPAPG